MVTFLNSYDFYDVEELVVRGIKYRVEWNLTNEVNEEATLDVSLGYFSEVANSIVLIFGFEFKQELYNHVTQEYSFKCKVNIVQNCSVSRNTKSCQICINEG